MDINIETIEPVEARYTVTLTLTDTEREEFERALGTALDYDELGDHEGRPHVSALFWAL